MHEFHEIIGGLSTRRKPITPEMTGKIWTGWSHRRNTSWTNEQSFLFFGINRATHNESTKWKKQEISLTTPPTRLRNSRTGVIPSFFRNCARRKIVRKKKTRPLSRYTHFLVGKSEKGSQSIVALIFTTAVIVGVVPSTSKKYILASKGVPWNTNIGGFTLPVSRTLVYTDGRTVKLCVISSRYKVTYKMFFKTRPAPELS
jgi:hypothetical protein